MNYTFHPKTRSKTPYRVYRTSTESSPNKISDHREDRQNNHENQNGRLRKWNNHSSMCLRFRTLRFCWRYVNLWFYFYDGYSITFFIPSIIRLSIDTVFSSLGEFCIAGLLVSCTDIVVISILCRCIMTTNDRANHQIVKNNIFSNWK